MACRNHRIGKSSDGAEQQQNKKEVTIWSYWYQFLLGDAPSLVFFTFSLHTVSMVRACKFRHRLASVSRGLTQPVLQWSLKIVAPARHTPHHPRREKVRTVVSSCTAYSSPFLLRGRPSVQLRAQRLLRITDEGRTSKSGIIPAGVMCSGLHRELKIL